MLANSLIVLAMDDGRIAARLYLLLVLPMLLILNVVYVPFHAPDDYDHFKRAYTLEHGSIFPVVVPGEILGGYVDEQLVQAIDKQRPVVIYWPRVGHASALNTEADRALNAPWSGRQVFSKSPASAYFPLVYLPQAAALWLSEKLNLTIYQSVFAARLANGVTAALIIAAALSELPFAVGSILLVLLLPKTLLQFGSNSADPILHALTLAILAFCIKAFVTDWSPRTRHFLLVALGVLVLAGVRPPIALLASLPLWIAWRRRNIVGGIALVSAVALAAAWFVLIAPLGGDPRCGATGTLSEKALAFLTQGPGLIARSLWVHGNYYHLSFVGELGWGYGPAGLLDRLPLWIYIAAIPLILSAMAYDMGQRVRIPSLLRLVLIFCAIGITAATFFAMYVVCSNVTSDAIGGVQGRYFVTPVFLLMPALAGTLPRRGFERLYPPALVLFALAAFITLVFEGLRIYWPSV